MVASNEKSLHNSDSTTSSSPSMRARVSKSARSAKVLAATAVHACGQAQRKRKLLAY